MPWIELKMKELRVVPNDAYKVVCFVCYSSCITVQTAKYGVHTTKPLAVIWKHPVMSAFYNPSNTVIFDDLRRNFAVSLLVRVLAGWLAG
jgi:ubiquitin-like domain-containing CTD phosphatase 1